MEKSLSDVARRVAEVRERIAAACRSVGRDPAEVTLMGVTKTVRPPAINAAIAAGLRYIGENRVQEFLEKKNDLQLDGVQAHLIGHLQTNKVRKIVGEVSMIQSVDSERLAQEIAAQSIERGITTPVLVEVNIGGEASKSGIRPSDAENFMRLLAKIPGISVKGMMTIPPILPTNEEKRKIFCQMHQLFIDISAKNIHNIDNRILSMGMSADFEEAVMEGATLVRVGSAIFGERQYLTV